MIFICLLKSFLGVREIMTKKANMVFIFSIILIFLGNIPIKMFAQIPVFILVLYWNVFIVLLNMQKNNHSAEVSNLIRYKNTEGQGEKGLTISEILNAQDNFGMDYDVLKVWYSTCKSKEDKVFVKQMLDGNYEKAFGTDVSTLSDNVLLLAEVFHIRSMRTDKNGKIVNLHLYTEIDNAMMSNGSGFVSKLSELGDKTLGKDDGSNEYKRKKATINLYKMEAAEIKKTENTGFLGIGYCNNISQGLMPKYLASSLCYNNGSIFMNFDNGFMSQKRPDDTSMMKHYFACVPITGTYNVQEDDDTKTYEEYLKMNEAEQRKYTFEALQKAIKYIPESDFSSGDFEITVPIGIGMTATLKATTAFKTNSSSDTNAATVWNMQKKNLSGAKYEDDHIEIQTDNGEHAVMEGVKIKDSEINIGIRENGGTAIGYTYIIGDTKLKFITERERNASSVQVSAETENDYYDIEDSLKIEKNSETDNNSYVYYGEQCRPVLASEMGISNDTAKHIIEATGGVVIIGGTAYMISQMIATGVFVIVLLV